MEVLQEINNNRPLAIALGYFDGIHIGHKKLISILLKKAKENNIKSAIITFDKNPADYFSSEPTPAIQTYKDKEILLDSYGLDFLYELDFENYKDLSAEDYIKILVKNFNPKYIIAGYNHTFGKEKSGNSSLLMELSKLYGYECIIVPEEKYQDKEEVSSTIIRKRIQYGHLNAIKALLGRNFSVRNSVIKGDKIARTLGYPTANLIWPSSMAKLPYGVYRGYAQVNSKIIPALISWGTKPTLSNGQNEVLEAHIYQFNEDLYGKIIKVIFDKQIRNEEKFTNIKLLKEQIHKDYNEFEKWASQLK